MSCSACGAPLPAGSDRCARCGALHGEHRKCPGCGAKAEVVRKGGLLYVCAACGRPRVPVEKPGIVRSGGERQALVHAESDLGSSRLATVLGIVALVATGLLLAFTSLAWLLDFGVAAAIAGVIALVVAVASAFAFSTSGRAKRRAEEAMRDAFGAVALDVMRARGPVTARELAEVLGVPEDVADRALARLPARTDVRVDTVLDDRATDGLVRYRIADATLPASAVEDAAAAEHAAFEERLRAAMREKGPS